MIQLPKRLVDSENGYRRRIGRTLRRLGVDLVVLLEWRFGEDVLWALPEGVAVICLCFVDRPDAKYYEYAAALAPQLEAIAGNSRTIVDKLKSALPAAYHSLVQYLPLGVGIPRKQKNPLWENGSPIRLVFLGRLTQEQKRVRDIVPFVKKLGALGVNYHLDVIGGGEEEELLRSQLASEVGVERVRILGQLAHDEALENLAGQHIFLLFSAYEGMPTSLLAALARGVVPVVTRVPSGVSDILVGELASGLFPIGAPDEAARLVADLADNRERWAELSRASKRLAGEFSLDGMIERYTQFFVSVIRSSRSKPQRRRSDPNVRLPWRTWLWLETPECLHQFVETIRAGLKKAE